MNRNILKISLVILLTFFLLNSAEAATKYWDNETADGLAKTPNNWNPNGLPIAGQDDVVFDNTSDADCSWDITEATYAVINNMSLNSGYDGVVTLAQATEIAGKLTVASGTFSTGTNFQLTLAGGYAQSGTSIFNANNSLILITNGGATAWNKTAGTFNKGNSTVRFTTNSQTIAAGGTDFYRLDINASGKIITASTELQTSQDCLIQNGTLALGSNNLTVAGVGLNYDTGGLTTSTGSLVTLSSGGNIRATNKTFDSLTLGDGTTRTCGMWTNMTINGQLTIKSNTGLSPNGYDITLTKSNATGANRPFIFESGATYGTANSSNIIKYTGSGTIDIETLNSHLGYGSLILDNASGTFQLRGDTLIQWDVTISNGTLDATASNHKLSLRRHFTNNAGANGFNARAGTLEFPSYCLNSNITSGGTSFYNLVTLKCNWTYTITTLDVLDVDNNLTITGGTFNTAYSVHIGDSSNTNSGNLDVQTNTNQKYTQTNGTTYIYSSASGSNTIGATGTGTITFNHLTIGNGSTTMTTTLGRQCTINGDLSVTGNATFDLNDIAPLGNITSSKTVYNPGTLKTGSATYTLYNVSNGGTLIIEQEGVPMPLTITTLANEVGSTVKYYYSGPPGNNQKIMETTYYNLTLDNSGNVIYAEPTAQVNNILNIVNGTFYPTGCTLTLAGTGTPLVISGSFDSGNSTVIYTGDTTATNVTAYTYNNLTINNANTTFTAAGSIACNGNMTLSAGTFDLSNKTLTVAGTLSVEGGMLDLQTSANQVKIGSGGTLQMTSAAGSSIVTADVATAPLLTTSGTEGTHSYNVNFTGGTLDVDEWDIRSVNATGVRIGSGVTVTNFNKITYTNFVSGAGTCDALLDITNLSPTLTGHTFPASWSGGECNVRLQTGGTVTMNTWTGGFGGCTYTCDSVNVSACGAGTVNWQGETCAVYQPRQSGALGSPMFF